MKIDFTLNGESGWFDPESGEYHYDGESAIAQSTLEHMSELGQSMRTTIDESDPLASPYETLSEPDPELVREKVLQNLEAAGHLELRG